jgi:hypothetical protein
MCGVSVHVPLTPSLFSRSTFWSCSDNPQIYPSSCHSFVTRSTLSWSRDTQIRGTRRIEEET